MANSGSAIRGSRVGAGPMGEQDRGYQAERVQRSYYCINGHVQNPQFAAHIDPTEIPDVIDCPNCGLPAGQDKMNPPQTAKHEPYKTHLAYVKERRTPEEAKALLDEAISTIRERRARLAEETARQAKAQAAKIKAAKAQAAKAVKTVKVESKASKPTKPAKVESQKPVAKKNAAPKTTKANAKVTKPVKPAKTAKPAAKQPSKAAAKKSTKK